MKHIDRVEGVARTAIVEGTPDGVERTHLRLEPRRSGNANGTSLPRAFGWHWAFSWPCAFGWHRAFSWHCAFS